ncbi:MAG: peptidoglycan DD-metalloendopeptidase family protein [Firmicutes bacterium]|nr:peptidoglycan DD-metalloendopeptidase family protein [Bacillota bacterium]
MKEQRPQKKNRRHKLWTVLLCFTLILSLSSIGTTTWAYGSNPTKADIQDELDDVENQKDETSKQISQVEKDIKSMQAKVNTLNASIKATSDEIAQTERNIAQKEKEMEQREDNLNNRLRAMYKNGSVGFFDVLMGSNSISEFVSNLEMIQRIYENDVNVMETLQREHEELKQIKAELNKKRAVLAEQKAEAAKEQAALDKRKKELEDKEDELLAQAKELESKLKTMIDTSSEYVGGTFIWPCPSSYYITSYAGYRMHPVLHVWKYHSGMDIAANYGASIVAAGSGKVILAGVYGGYGNCVMIDHGGGIVTIYGHASSLLVATGQTVTQGQEIAKVGSTGISSGNHLHFEVRNNGVIEDPLNYLKG